VVKKFSTIQKNRLATIQRETKGILKKNNVVIFVMSTRNIEFINTFKWKDKDGKYNQIIKEHRLLVDCEFLKSNNISDVINASGLILIFKHYYNIDIGDYGFRDCIIDNNEPKITLHLKERDYREIIISDILK
jgi:hypothetical protein